MLINGTSVIENIDEGNLSRELEIAKFRNYARENYSELIVYNSNFEDFIENSSKFFSISLPDEIAEYFIRFDAAPFFFLSEAPILNQIEDSLLVKKTNQNTVCNFREIKNYYYKWITQKFPKDKNFYANSLINSVERNYLFQSYYNLILYGVLLTYDDISYNPKRAIELYDRAKELAEQENISPKMKHNIIYLISILKGFVYLKEYEYLKSLEIFKEAISYNNYGITAYFYSALSAKYIDDFDLSYDYLGEVIKFDKARFSYAINYNHLSLFTFFYKNAVFYNVFADSGFAQLLPDIDFLIRSHFSSDENSMEFTYSKLINLNNLPIKEFYNKSVGIEIKFLKNALDQYKHKRTGLIRIVEQIFREKLITLVEFIRQLIEEHYFDQIKDEINVFDRQIEQNKRHLTRIKHEMEDANKKVKLNLDEAAEYLEHNLTERSTLLEEKIKNLEKANKYNPSHVLYTSMVFNVFVCFIVFTVISVITAFVGFGGEFPSNQLAIKTGLRWSGITFAVGVIISVFTTFSTFWEKSSERKNLTAQLKKIKESEAEERENIKDESEMKLKVYEQKFKDRIKTQEKIILNFEKEREQNYNQKYKLAKKEIEEYISPLNELLKSLNSAG